MLSNDKKELERERDILRQVNITLRDENITLKSAITATQNDLDTLVTQEKAKIASISELNTQETELQRSIIALSALVDKKNREIATLDTEYQGKQKRYTEDLERLEAVRQSVSEEVLIGRQEIESMRAELSIRQKNLDERDSNLRLREARVTEQEKTVIRNYNLLDL